MLARLAIAAVASALVPLAAAAQEAPASEWNVSGSLSAANNGMSKGASETGNEAQVVASVKAARGPFFLASKFKNVRTSSGDVLRHEYGGGYENEIGGFDVSVEASYKINGEGGPQRAYFELDGQISRELSSGTTLNLRMIYTPDNAGATEMASFVEIGASQKLSSQWNVSGAVGARRLSPARDFNTLNLGVTYRGWPKGNIDLRYYTTDHKEYGETHDDNLVLKLSQGF